MLRTLSHRAERLETSAPGNPPAACRRNASAFGGIAALALVFLLLGSSLGCQAESDAPNAAVARDVPMEAEGNQPFVWPEDPSHPVLEIQITSRAANGSILIELMPELAPVTVNRVIELADDGYYDKTTFHRVIPGFMIQGGDPKSRDRDPTNDGQGRLTHPLQDEFGRAPFERGVVGMANKGHENTTSSQFFIMHATAENLAGRYTAIGRVLEGMDLVDAMTTVKIDESGRWGPKDRPIENIVMKKVHTVGARDEVLARLGRDGAAAERTESSATTGTSQAAFTPDSAAPKEAKAALAVPAAPGGGADWERLEADGR